MKIEFEVSRGEAKLLVRGLRHLMTQTNSEDTVKALRGIVKEIEKDAVMEKTIFDQLEYYLRDNRNLQVPFRLASTLRENLNISQSFIQSTHGLKVECNQILKNISTRFKPGKPVTTVSIQKVRNCKTVQDIVNVIIDRYETV